MAFGNPVVAPNMAFEEFNQGLQPGLQSLYHQLSQHAAFNQQTKLENQRETARAALANTKLHADDEATSDALSALHPETAPLMKASNIDPRSRAGVKYLTAYHALHLKDGTLRPEQVKQAEGNAVLQNMYQHAMVPGGGPPPPDSAYMQAGGTGANASVLGALAPEYFKQHLGMALAPDAKDAQKQADVAYHQQLSDYGKVSTLAMEAGYPETGKVDGILKNMQKDPVFMAKPPAEQRQIETQIRDQGMADEKKYIALNAQRIIDQKQAQADEISEGRALMHENTQAIISDRTNKEAESKAKIEQDRLDREDKLKSDIRKEFREEIDKQFEHDQKALQWDDTKKPVRGKIDENEVDKEFLIRHGTPEQKAAARGGASSAPVKVSTPEELNALPKGAHYVAPDGSQWIK